MAFTQDMLHYPSIDQNHKNASVVQEILGKRHRKLISGARDLANSLYLDKQEMTKTQMSLKSLRQSLN